MEQCYKCGCKNFEVFIKKETMVTQFSIFNFPAYTVRKCNKCGDEYINPIIKQGIEQIKREFAVSTHSHQNIETATCTIK